MATAIPIGSTVLITGANGYIASHIADQFLLARYKVRGTVRSAAKGEIFKHGLETRHPGADISFVVVPEMATPGAFDEAVKGVSGVLHVASNTDLRPGQNPIEYVDKVVEGVKSILVSATKEPSVKRFVLTSSSAAALMPPMNVVLEVDESSWNEEALKEAQTNKEASGVTAYAASKAAAEQFLWKYVKEERPAFSVNSVLPNCNFGDQILEGQQSPTSVAIPMILKGDIGFPVNVFEPQFFVHVQDTARLHVAALTFSDVTNKRIFAYNKEFNWSDVYAIIAELRPGWKAPHNPMGSDRSLIVVKERDYAEGLLKRLGRDGFVNLKEAVREAIEGL